MKNLYLLGMMTLGLVAFAFAIGCSRTLEQKEADSKATLADAKDKQAANEEAQDEWTKFKSEAYDKISENDSVIKDYIALMTTANGSLNGMYDKNIEVLAKKNVALNTSLDEYRPDVKNTLEQFKSDFNRDMGELGTALEKYAVADKKQVKKL